MHIYEWGDDEGGNRNLGEGERWSKNLCRDVNFM